MLKILDGGFQTTVQDYPGRVGYWSVGVPPSGPMDSYSFRLGNKLVGNPMGEAAIEFIAPGPKIEFQKDNVIAITGANVDPKLDGESIPMWESIKVSPGQKLLFGNTPKKGFRAYLCISGGIEVPEFLGSKSTFFVYGGIGGYKGRKLKRDDGIKTVEPNGILDDLVGRKVKEEVRPEFKNNWKVKAIPGPDADPEYLTKEDMELFFDHEWGVSKSSNRIGVRLEGPEFEWAREGGGEGGKHPSNVLDRPYSIGNVNFTGEMPIILMNDGPSLGGFITNVTIPQAELWKVGQAFPDRDKIKFERITLEESIELRKKRLNQLEQVIRK